MTVEELLKLLYKFDRKRQVIFETPWEGFDIHSVKISSDGKVRILGDNW